MCDHDNIKFYTEMSDRGTEFNVAECNDCDFVMVS